jgi:hypothetical protein
VVTTALLHRQVTGGAVIGISDGGLIFAAKGTFGSFALTPSARRRTTSAAGAGALSVREPT